MVGPRDRRLPHRGPPSAARGTAGDSAEPPFVGGTGFRKRRFSPFQVALHFLPVALAGFRFDFRGAWVFLIPWAQGTLGPSPAGGAEAMRLEKMKNEKSKKLIIAFLRKMKNEKAENPQK